MIVLSLLVVSCATTAGEENETRFVTAVFAKEEAQLYTNADGGKDMIDTVWIYYSDGTFEQYAELGETAALFSTGSYEIGGDGDFVIDENETVVNLTIRRSSKYQNGLLSKYASEHTYALGELGFEKLYAFESDSRTIEAVFYGKDKQLFVEEDGAREMLDTIWIYYSDMTFEQFAPIDGAMTLFSTGSYAFADGGDFIYEADEADYGDIVLNRTQKYQAGKGLTAYESSHTYDLKSLGFVVLVAPEK